MTKSAGLTLVVFLSLARTLQAQVKEGAVYQNKLTEVEIKLANRTFKILEHNTSDRVFYSNFDRYSHQSVFSNDLCPVFAFEAKTLTPRPKKSSFIETKVETVETKDLVQSGIFYGGDKRMDFVFPNISSGAIGRLQYQREIKDVHLITPFFFDEGIPVDNSEFSVVFPKNVSIKHVLFGDLKDKVVFSKIERDNSIKYSWVLKNIPSFETARKSPGFSYHGTHVIIWVESFTEDGKTNPVTSGVSDLYKWYATLMKQIPKGASYNLLDQQITSLTAQAKTKEEATRTIFQWVQKNIKYIAFEQGMSGLIPREASDVYNKRYGDCKDMANLLTYMLNKAGVESYRTWIGSRHRPYKFEMVPLPIAHDHMICTAKVDDRFIFLDATDSFLDFNRPSSFIQGKEALVGMNDNEFKIENVPVRKREENQRIDSLFIHLEKDGVKGKLVSHLTGYKKEDFEKEKMRDEVNHRPNYLRDFCLIGADNVQIENILLKGFNNPDTGGKIQFDFFQPGYYKSVGNKLYLNMGMSRSLPGEIVPSDSRDQSMEEGYLFETKSITQLTLPEGYRVSSIPNDFEAKWNEFGVSSKYHMKNNVITREYVFYSNYLYLNKPLFKQWNDFIQATTDVNRQVITLSKTEN